MCMTHVTPTELSIFIIFMLTYTVCEIYTQLHKQ